MKMKAKCFFRKLNFLIALGGVLAALFFYGCDNLLASASPDTTPVNFVPVAAREGYGIVNGTLPSSDSASARTAMPGAAVAVVSYKVFAQNGSDRIEANVNNSTSTFSISLPYGTWNVTARGLDAGGNIVATQTKPVTLSETASSVNISFELGYSTNSADGYGKTSLSVSFPASQIHGVEYTLSKGETKISVNVSELTGSFKIERTFEDLGAWHLTIKFYGDFSNLVYRIDQTVNVYANLTTDTFEGSAPYISGGAIALTEALLADFQNTTLYVDAARGKDTNTGTQFDPLETFNRAVELVNNSTRDASTEFRIFLQSHVADGAQLELKAGKKLTVANADGAFYTIESLGRTFTVNATSELTLQSVKFKKLRFEVSGSLEMNGGEISGNTADNGGAVYVAGGTFTMNDGTIIDNTAAFGGGIQIADGGTFEMSGGTISENHALGNGTDGGGGGVHIYSGTFEMTGGTISKNDCGGNSNDSGGGGIFIYNGNTATISGGIISENFSSVKGGGIYLMPGGTLKVSGTAEISKNSSSTNGGGVYIRETSTFTMSGGAISDNTAMNGGGGGVYIYKGTFIMEGGIVSGNATTNFHGGGVCVTDGGTFTMKGGTIGGSAESEKNTAKVKGGAVYVNTNATFTMNGGSITGNTANYGGGTYINTNGSFTIHGGIISGNTASTNGGAVYVDTNATFTMDGTTSTISNNTAQNAGGVYVKENGTFTMKGGTISENKASVDGGAVYVNSNATFTMADGTISENTASIFGGGVCIAGDFSTHAFGTFTMKGGTITDNEATDSTKGFGGGVCAYNGAFIMEGGTISKNIAYDGGGIWTNIYSEFEMNGGTVSENIANTNGGGVYAAGGTFEMNGGTISENTANTNGGGVYVAGGTFEMSDTAIISENKANTDGGGVYIANGSFTMKEGIISKNESQYGSGVYITINGTFIMDDGKIIDNLTGNGVWSKGTFEMNGGIIRGHSVIGKGGGVYVNGGSFTMNGGTVRGNAAADKGNGAYINSTFNMSGNAKFEDNDIYLDNANTITVAGALTATTPVATITPSSYEEEWQVLSAGAGFTMTQGTCKQFALTALPDDDTDWKISPNADGTAGILKVNLNTIYVRGSNATWYTSNEPTAANGSDSNSGNLLSPFATIQKALDTVFEDNDGASPYTIYVDGIVTPGAASADGIADFSALTQDLTLTIKALSETAKATLDAGGTSRVMNAKPTGGTLKLTLENLVIKGGNVTDNSGGGINFISAGGILTMTGCEVLGNESNYGGGIYTTGALEMESCTVSGNTTSAYGGGIDIDGCTVKMKDCTIDGNTANSQGGGGIYIEGSAAVLEMEGCTISDCKALGSYNGGGIYNASGTLELTGVTITLEGDGTRAAYQGGGIFNAGTLTMKGGSITGGGRLSSNVFQGGGIYNTGALTIEGVTISNFYATSRGGGIYNNNGETAADFATIKDCIITNCGSAQKGSGICTYEGKLKLENVDIIGGTAGESSGIYCYTSELTIIGGKIDGFEGNGIYTNSNSKLKMDGTTVSGNTSEDDGVGVEVYCPFEIKNCTITGNTAENWSSFQGGGGLYISNCTGTITNTTISGNTAVLYGGGVYIHGTADVTITGCIIKDNTATKGDGGGVYVYGGTFTMEDGTISGNEANYGGGVYVNKRNTYSATFTMKKGTISGNTARGKVDAGTLDGGGGGVYINASTFTMEGGEISGNETAGNENNSGGGGVYAFGGNDSGSTSTFTMTGGTVTGNTAANGQGNGAFISPNCAMNMSGAAQFADTDDVYLYVYTGATLPTITVAGNLSKTKVATITLPDSAYAAGTQVLSAGDGVNIYEYDCNKFAVTPDPDGGEWKVVYSTGYKAGELFRPAFYVRGTGAGWYAENPGFVAAAGSDTTGNGSKAKPFATIQKAIDEMLAQNDGRRKYTIYVDGTLTQSAAPSGGRGMADFSASNKTLYLTIEALSATTKATLDANQKSRVIYASPASGSLYLKMKNLIVTNGYVRTGTGKGGGIYWDGSQDGWDNVIEGCVISGNEAKEGGGIYANWSFAMKDCTISGNTANNGGGVYTESSYTMNSGSTISGNTASNDGGGVYVENSGSCNFTMADGTITGNTASGNGGGVYDEGGRFIQNGGTVTGNTPNDVYPAS